MRHWPSRSRREVTAIYVIAARNNSRNIDWTPSNLI